MRRCSPAPTLPQLFTSGLTSARAPCGWRMETSKKPLQVGGGSVESPLQRKARGAADLWKAGAALCVPRNLGKNMPQQLERRDGWARSSTIS